VRTRTDDLIESLAAGLQPVQRLRAPLLRALSWLLLVAALGALFVGHYADLGLFMTRMKAARVALEALGEGLTAITAVIVAFQWSIPGRSRRWAWLPVGPLLLWLAASGWGCFADGLVSQSTQEAAGESVHCFLFIAGLSVPLSLGLFWMLRRATTLTPLRVAAFATLGVAASAATLLQFFHPFDITLIDLGFHVGAVALVMLVGTALRQPLLRAS
jgi:hypothetical protein